LDLHSDFSSRSESWCFRIPKDEIGQAHLRNLALIDSSVLIAAERGSLDLGALEREYAHVDFAIAAITASELLHGVHRAKGRTRRVRREAFVEAILASLPVLAFDDLAARVHARLWARLASKGRSIGAHDLLIAATAIARGLDVVTRDERSIPRIPELKVIRW
jgi:predicted nucleic acid-binding protein